MRYGACMTLSAPRRPPEPHEVTDLPVVMVGYPVYNHLYLAMDKIQSEIIVRSHSEPVAAAGYPNLLLWPTPFGERGCEPIVIVPTHSQWVAELEEELLIECKTFCRIMRDEPGSTERAAAITNLIAAINAWDAVPDDRRKWDEEVSLA